MGGSVDRGRSPTRLIPLSLRFSLPLLLACAEPPVWPISGETPLSACPDLLVGVTFRGHLSFSYLKTRFRYPDPDPNPDPHPDPDPGLAGRGRPARRGRALRVWSAQHGRQTSLPSGRQTSPGHQDRARRPGTAGAQIATIATIVHIVGTAEIPTSKPNPGDLAAAPGPPARRPRRPAGPARVGLPPQRFAR
jgi:hypothetical protein